MRNAFLNNRRKCMEETIGATARLGRFVADTATRTLPPEVAAKAAFCLLDALGLALLAGTEKTVVAINALLTPLPDGAARVWGDGRRVALADAVTANAVAVHAQFHDDTDYSSWTHPGSLVVPVAVALAESADAPLSEVLRAIAVGYDAIEWLGARDEVARGLIERGIRTSPTLGTVAAAASAAAVLRLDRAQAANAIGIASSITGGALEAVRSGSDEWRIQNAHAARGGLLAAQLAQQGIAGAAQGLEGPKGLLRALAGLDAVPAVWHETPRIDAILGVSAKPWATLGDNMSAVIAAKLLRERPQPAARIAKITIRIWRHFTEYPGTSYRGPFERVTQALASMAFATAAMLVCGELEYDISAERRNDRRILDLIPLISIEPDDLGTPYDATVTVEFEDGTVMTNSADEGNASQLFHDRATATALFENRLTRSGYPAGTGASAAAAAIDAATGGSMPSMRQWLDRLAPPSSPLSRRAPHA
jgi:2-methylcitrate dehydratase PrpD